MAFVRLCDQLEVLTVLSEQFVALQHSTQTNTAFQSGALEQVLRRTQMLKGHEGQMRKLKGKIDKVEIRDPARSLRFTFQKQQILDDLEIVQKIRSNLESTLRLDDR